MRLIKIPAKKIKAKIMIYPAGTLLALEKNQKLNQSKNKNKNKSKNRR